MPQSSTTSASSTGPARGSEQSLVRAVGVWGLAAAIANVTIGGGIFRLPASVAGALGAAARSTCERIDWSHIVAEFEQALLELTAEPSRFAYPADAFA